jgi:hypothetical protein
MNPLSRRILHVVCFAFVSTASSAQWYSLQGHDAEIGVAATGQYTSTVSTMTLNNTTATPLGQGSSCAVKGPSTLQGAHQVVSCPADQSNLASPTGPVEPSTTDSPGVLVTFRDKPFTWATVEFNYQYTKFSERYFSVPGSTTTVSPIAVPTNMHEATAAYLRKFKRIGRMNPFVGAGGGALFFAPIVAAVSQWRGAGLVEAGVDFQTESRLGFRIGARDLIYRAPTYALANVPSTWVSTAQPYAGVYVKF